MAIANAPLQKAIAVTTSKPTDGDREAESYLKCDTQSHPLQLSNERNYLFSQEQTSS